MIRYYHDRPYRWRVIEIQKYAGMVSFAEDAQFWTLGGPEHFEFIELNKSLQFGPRSYHTVEQHAMEPKPPDNPDAMVLYGKTKFVAAIGQWKPVVISYDSQEVMAEVKGIRQDRKIIDLVDLTRRALANSEHNTLVVHANYMVSYPAICPGSDDHAFKEKLCRTYTRWYNIYRHMLSGEAEIEMCDGGVEKMIESRTEMLSIHAILRW